MFNRFDERSQLELYRWQVASVFGMQTALCNHPTPPENALCSKNAFAAEPALAADRAHSIDTADMQILGQIRDQEFNHFHVMAFASGLADGIGARLTGSRAYGKALTGGG